MKIVVIGGSGRIGQKLVYNLHQDSCCVFEASPSFGVNTITGSGPAEALTGAGIVVDVSNSPSLKDRLRRRSSRRRAAISRPAAGLPILVGFAKRPADRLSSYAICWTHGCTMSCSDIANPASYMLLGRMLPGTIPQSARNRAPARNDVGGNVCRRS
jgi:hypothetical protein